MTKNEYLNELGVRIAKLPETERNEALAFYTEYFEDAENDEAAMETLDTPARLAAQISAEYSARMLEDSAQNPRTTSPPPVLPPIYGPRMEGVTPPPPGYTRADYAGANHEASSPPSYLPSGKEKSSLSWIWAVILGIFALPVALPLLIAAVVIVFSVALVCFALVFALVVVIAALIVGGIFALFSVGAAAAGPGSILLIVGGAMVALGLGLILIPLLIRFCSWMVKRIGRLVSRIFDKLQRRTRPEDKQP